MAIEGSGRWARWVGMAERRARWQPSPDDDARPVVAPPGWVDPDTPLFDVPFVVLDVETTGASPAMGALIEIAAARYRAGECDGVFQTLVDPAVPIPPLLSLLTGITDSMVAGAPEIGGVLPSLLEFLRASVLVGHNVAFDLSFLDAALCAHGRDPLDHQSVDTLALARSILRPDVPNCRLATLARALQLQHRPSHRALDDVLATADLLHGLIERATGYGVFVLADLMMLPSARRAHAS